MEFFSTLAECSITFAGFAAVHALLQGSAGPRGIMRAWMTLSPGMMAFVLALLPQLIAELEIGIAELWQWSSVIACVLAIPLNLSLFREDIRLKRLGYPRQPGFFNARVAMVFSSAASLAFLYSATIDPLLSTTDWGWR